MPLLGAVLAGRRSALAAEAGLEAAGRVVDAGVDDAAVVPGLVPGDLGLLLDDEDVRARSPAQDLVCRRETDDPAADDDDVTHGPSTRVRPGWRCVPRRGPSTAATKRGHAVMSWARQRRACSVISRERSSASRRSSRSRRWPSSTSCRSRAPASRSTRICSRVMPASLLRWMIAMRTRSSWP